MWDGFNAGFGAYCEQFTHSLDCKFCKQELTRVHGHHTHFYCAQCDVTYTEEILRTWDGRMQKALEREMAIHA